MFLVLESTSRVREIAKGNELVRKRVLEPMVYGVLQRDDYFFFCLF